MEYNISHLLSIESPVAQWLVHLARSQGVMALNYFWNLDFFSEFSVGAISVMYTSYWQSSRSIL